MPSRKRSLRFLYIGIALTSLSVSQVQGTPNLTGIRLVYTSEKGIGNWHPGTGFKNGKNWLALSCTEMQCAFEAAELKVENESYVGPYDDPDQPTPGQRLNFRKKAESASNVIAWFQMAKPFYWLKSGPVTTYYPAGRRLSRPHSQGTMEAELKLPNGQSVIFVPMIEHPIVTGGEHEYPTFHLQLRSRGKRQLLPGSSGACATEMKPQEYVQWVGDFDEDGEPDYLISWVVDLDHSAAVDLYLSTLAKPGELVGLAARYITADSGTEC